MIVRRGWVLTFVAVFALCLVFMVVVNAAGGFAHPVFFVGLGVAAGGLAAGVRVAVGRIEPWTWPESEVAPPRVRRLGADDRALSHQHRLSRDNSTARATALRPILTDVVADRLHRSHGIGHDETAERARGLVSAELAGLIDGSRTTLTLDEFDTLMKEIETL